MSHDIERITQAFADRYAIERELGSGGMATVYLAEDLKHRRPVAIKVLQRELAHTLGVDRFLREIEVIGRLQHPHILTLIDSGEIDGLPYYVMPFVQGQSLRDHLENTGPMSVDEAVRITREIADGLQHAHDHGVIHRDIKPANVLMSDDHPIIADFGIATALEHATVGRITETGISLGSPVYMSPEQAAGERDLDSRTDIYSLGCVTYEMLAGDPPITEGSMQAIVGKKLAGKWPALREVRKDIPVEIDRAVAKAIATDAADRFADAKSYADALEVGAAHAHQGAAGQATRRRTMTIAGVSVLAVVALSIVFVQSRARNERRLWATQQVAQLELLASTAQYAEAYALAEQLDTIIPDDTALARMRPLFTDFFPVITDVPGATVYRQLYDEPADQWTRIGTTPIDSLALPKWGNGFAMRLRIELEGYAPTFLLPVAISDWRRQWPGMDTVRLERPGDVPTGMVRIPGYPMNDPANPGEQIQLKDYWIDRFETTNGEYQEFVDAGGYENREYWVEPFLRDGVAISWEEGIAQFNDETGRPGPSTWRFGRYAEGQDNYPVGGVSFYEAAAYARFRGKVLPPSLHWYRAARRYARETTWIVHPRSNLGGDGPWEVGSRRSMNSYGVYDVAGNVREWCSNLMDGERFTQGAAWSDPRFETGWRIRVPSFDRSLTNGIRLMMHFEDDATYALLTAPVGNNAARDYRGVAPVSDAEFAIYRRLYDYEPTPLESVVEIEGSTEYYSWFKVTFDAGYGGERGGAYIFLPHEGEPPYQSILYWPGAGAMQERQMDHEFIQQWTGFVMQSGRALVLPLFKGSYERDDADFSISRSTWGNALTYYRDLSIQWIKDLRRTVEYLESSEEFDEEKIGFYGHSWGGIVAPVALVLEPRIKVTVLDVGGFWVFGSDPFPEFDPVNFAPRVTSPVLMLNGEFDQVFPLEIAQKPMFELLGGDKEHYVFPAGHVVPRDSVITHSLAWYDKYLGAPGR